MALETRTLTAMAIAISGAGLLTVWCLWSRCLELRERKMDKK
jgi:hypothetical protein